MLDTALMLIATVLSLAYSLWFISHVFFGQPKTTTENRTFKVPKFMTSGNGYFGSAHGRYWNRPCILH